MFVKKGAETAGASVTGDRDVNAAQETGRWRISLRGGSVQHDCHRHYLLYVRCIQLQSRVFCSGTQRGGTSCKRHNDAQI